MAEPGDDFWLTVDLPWCVSMLLLGTGAAPVLATE